MAYLRVLRMVIILVITIIVKRYGYPLLATTFVPITVSD